MSESWTSLSTYWKLSTLLYLCIVCDHILTQSNFKDAFNNYTYGFCKISKSNLKYSPILHTVGFS